MPRGYEGEGYRAGSVGSLYSRANDARDRKKRFRWNNRAIFADDNSLTKPLRWSR